MDAVEFDVQLTSDNKVIVFHGPKLPGSDLMIYDMTFGQAMAVAKKMNMGKQVEYTTFSETICRMIHRVKLSREQ